MKTNQRIKPSYFNFVVPVDDNDALLYNTKNTGLVQLTAEEGAFLNEVATQEEISVAEYPDRAELLNSLYDRGFFHDADVNEKQILHKIYSLEKDVYSKDAADINLTIGTTILCNMGCSYCFEFVKPNKTMKDEKIIEGVATYLKDMIKKSPVNNWRKLNVVWYGGEPLINKAAIEKLSPLLIQLCEEEGMQYQAEIITNGLLLTEETWQLLKENKVINAQVTIDGPKDIHDASRPLLGGKKLGNYDRIMRNLALMPDGMNLTIRVNLDKRIFHRFREMLEDFKSHGIWPQRYQQVHLDISWLRTYEEELQKGEVNDRLDVHEFYYALRDLKRLKLEFYNEWAETVGLKRSKLKWDLPELQAECATWVSPYSMVVDPEGNIHKCWETIHDEKEGVSHVFDEYDVELYDEHSRYDRYQTSHEKCKGCKFIPICDQLSCSHQVIGEKEPPCTYWKYVLTKSLKEQFLYMKEHPEDLVLAPKKSVNTGHSNK